MKKYRHLRGTLFDIERELRSRNSGADEAISEAMVTRTKSEGSRRSASAPPDRRMSNRSVSTQGTVESDMSDMESGESGMSLTDSEVDAKIWEPASTADKAAAKRDIDSKTDIGSRFALQITGAALAIRQEIVKETGGKVPIAGDTGANTLTRVGTYANQLNTTEDEWTEWPLNSTRPLIYRRELPKDGSKEPGKTIVKPLDEYAFNVIKEFIIYAETQNKSVEHPWWERFKTA